MSATQTIIGAIALTIAGNAAIDAVLPDPSPIRVHALEYSDGMIKQDRTIKAKGEVFFMAWSAEIVDADTGLAVTDCTGSGAWNYTVGRMEFAMSLARWTGNAACADALVPGVWYYPRAVYSWGASQTSAVGERFKVE